MTQLNPTSLKIIRFSLRILHNTIICFPIIPQKAAWT